MDSPDPKAPGFVDLVKSWIPRKTTESSSSTSTSHMSRDFWMPDHSCPVCYECDAQFTVFNRRHHCRLCGRVFCAKCAANSIPSPSDETKDCHEESSSDRRIRVCNYCYKQWEQGIVPPDKGASIISLHFSSSPSASTTSNCTSNSSNCTVDSATGPKTNPPGSGRVSSNMDMQNASSSSSHRNHSSQDPVEFFVNR